MRTRLQPVSRAGSGTGRALPAAALLLVALTARPSGATVVTGQVTASTGQGVVNVDVDFEDAGTGQRVARNTTDPLGFYAVDVPAGPYDIRFRPQAGDPYLTSWVLGHDVAGATAVFDWILEDAFLVSGTVVDDVGQPVPGVDLDFIDSVTGVRLAVSWDDSGPNGGFEVAVPAGTYDIDFDPPRGSRLLPTVIPAVVVDGHLSLGTVALESGFLVTGRVVDPSLTPVAAADLDARDATTGTAVPLARDDTDGAGAFVVAVRGGSYAFEFAPPPGLPLLVRVLEPVVVTADLDLGDVVLEAGWLLSGRVVDGSGQPVAGIDLDVADAATGIDWPLGVDVTDASGRFELVVPAGTHDVDLDPPVASRLLPRRLEDVVVTGDLDLGDLVLEAGYLLGGRAVDGTAQPVPGVDVDVVDRATGEKLRLTGDDSDASGTFGVIVPAGSFDVELAPPRGLPLRPRLLLGIEIAGDTDLGDVVLEGGWLVSLRVLDRFLAPVVGADVDVRDVATRESLVLGDDDSGPDGRVTVVVPSGTFDVEVAGPVERALAPAVLADRSIGADVDLGDVVLDAGLRLDGLVQAVDGSPIPGVQVRLTDPASGLRLPDGSRATDADGRFAFAVAAGDLDVGFEPGRGSPFLPARLLGISLTADVTLPPVTLEAAVLASGLVTDELDVPVAAVSLTWLDAVTGQAEDVRHGVTDDAGEYVVAVRPGAHDVLFEPLPGDGLAPAWLRAQQLDADLRLPTVRLARSFVLSGRVVDGTGAGVGDVVVSLVDSVTREAVPGLGPPSTATGDFALEVRAGRFDLTFVPPPGSGLGQETRVGVDVPADTDIGDVVLPPSVTPSLVAIDPATGPASGGTPVVVTGAGFAPGVELALGGMSLADIRLIDPGTVEAVTRPRPPGTVALSARNVGTATALLEGAYTYVEPDPPPFLTVTRDSPARFDARLEWTATGNPLHAVFRSADPSVFGDGEVFRVLPGTSLVETAPVAGSRVWYFVVE